MTYRVLSLGVNQTPYSPTDLRFAEDDALRMARLWAGSRGPAESEHVTLLRGRQATLDAVRAELEMLTIFPPVYFVFGWAGHGSEEGIALADGVLSYEELAWWLSAIDARVKVAVLATCHAGAAAVRFKTKIAGVGDLGADWRRVLLRACPGLRLFAAVGTNALAYYDAAVGGSRFLYGFFTALRMSAGDLVVGSNSWISDTALLPRVRAIIAERWPGEALPELSGPSCRRSPFPLVLSQAAKPVGSSVIMPVMPGDGVSVRIAVEAYNRKFVDTWIEVVANTDDGATIDAARVSFVPTATEARFEQRFSIGSRNLLANPRTGLRLRAGLPVRLLWSIRVLDDHSHVLSQRAFENTYWSQSRVA